MKLARTLTLGAALTALVLVPLPGCMGGAGGGGCGKMMGLLLSVGAAVGSALLIKELTK